MLHKRKKCYVCDKNRLHAPEHTLDFFHWRCVKCGTIITLLKSDEEKEENETK